MGRSTWRRTAVTGAVAVLALALTGCLQDPGDSGGGAGGISGSVDNNQDDGDGVVTILGAYGGDEKENFEKALAPFEEESGIDIKYTEDTDFTTTIKTRVAAGDTPDIGFFPQPGGLLELAADGKIQPIDTYLDYDAIDETLVPGLLESARLQRPASTAPRCGSRTRASSGTRRRSGTQPATRCRRRCRSSTDARRPDQGRRHHAVVHGLERRPGDRLGRHRLDRAVRAHAQRARGLQPVDQPRDPVRRPADRRGVRRVRQDRQDRRRGATAARRPS